MKEIQIERVDPDIIVIGINSHSKPYYLCWKINKNVKTRFIKQKNHVLKQSQEFERYTYIDKTTNSQYDLLANHCSTGTLVCDYKKINYFLKVHNQLWNIEKQKFLEKLNKIPEILLIFDLKLTKISSLTPFILND